MYQLCISYVSAMYQLCISYVSAMYQLCISYGNYGLEASSNMPSWTAWKLYILHQKKLQPDVTTGAATSNSATGWAHGIALSRWTVTETAPGLARHSRPHRVPTGVAPWMSTISPISPPMTDPWCW